MECGGDSASETGACGEVQALLGTNLTLSLSLLLLLAEPHPALAFRWLSAFLLPTGPSPLASLQRGHGWPTQVWLSSGLSPVCRAESLLEEEKSI